MPLLDTIRSLFRKEEMESSPIVEVSTAEPGNLPSGFFISLGALGEQGSLGFHCPKCGFTARHSAENGVVHCGRRESAPEDAEKLEVVRWNFPAKGTVRLANGDRIMTLDAGEWNGEVGYEPGKPGGMF